MSKVNYVLDSLKLKSLKGMVCHSSYGTALKSEIRGLYSEWLAYQVNKHKQATLFLHVAASNN
jgi:hypothetical protein